MRRGGGGGGGNLTLCVCITPTLSICGCVCVFVYTHMCWCMCVCVCMCGKGLIFVVWNRLSGTSSVLEDVCVFVTERRLFFLVVFWNPQEWTSCDMRLPDWAGTEHLVHPWYITTPGQTSGIRAGFSVTVHFSSWPVKENILLASSATPLNCLWHLCVDWVELGWDELSWTELSWVGLSWTELNWVCHYYSQLFFLTYFSLIWYLTLDESIFQMNRCWLGKCQCKLVRLGLHTPARLTLPTTHSSTDISNSR